MAKIISDENIRLNIIINSDNAQKELFDLEASTRKLRTTNAELRAEKTKLRLEGKQGTEAYKKLSAEITENNVTLSKNKARMNELQKEIGITGLTMNQLSQKALILRTQLKNAVPGSAAYIQYQNELKQVSGRLSELSGKAKLTKLSLSSIAGGFNKYAALGATVIATGTGMILSLQKMIDFNGKLSDAQADVRKTTNMSRIEVDELTKSFGMFITRTSRIDLLKIAEVGGRIGIAKNEIASFTKQMNIAAVSLGDSFTGGAEEVATKLGKLRFLFQETKDIGVDIAYNAIGSAINQLGASGAATEVNIADFATNVGALPDVLKPSISEALGLGAAFEESGVGAEKAGRGYGIFIRNASTNTEKFARVMNLSVKQVEDLINTNPTEFFLQFSEGLKGMDATQVGKTLEYLGLNADGVNKIVGAAGSNIDRFRTLLELSNQSMIQGTSLINEYNIKNNNLAATISKVTKKMVGLFTSITISQGLNNFLIWFGKFIGAVEDTDGKTTIWRNRLIALIKTILIITTAMVSYKTAVRLATLWTDRATIGTAAYNLIQKITTATTNFLVAATLLGKAAFFALTGQLAAARTAMVAFNLVTKLSPIGLVVGLLSAATVAYLAFSESSKEAATKQSVLNDAINEATKSTATQKNNLEQLLKIARDETQSKIERQKAIDELNKTVPAYNNNLTIESLNTLAVTQKLEDYIIAINNAAKAKYFKSMADKKAEELATAESSSLEDNLKWYDHLWNSLKAGGNYYSYIANNIETASKRKQHLIDLSKDELKIANELYAEQLKNNNKGNTSSSVPQEGDTMVKGGVTYVYTNGAWKKQSGFNVITPEDQAVIDSKKKLAEFLDDFEKDQELRKELSKIDKLKREEVEEIIKIEAKYQKMAEDAGFETTIAAGLEEAKQFELSQIRDKWDAKRLKEKEANDKKYNQLDEKYKKDLIKAEQNLEKAKKDLMNSGVETLGMIIGKKSILYKLLFGLEKALAINDVIVSSTKAIAEINASAAIARAKAWAISPLTLGEPFASLITAAAIKNVVATKLTAGVQIASILGTAIQGFESGLYPVIREQDGKPFNAVYGGNTQSGLVNKPTIFKSRKGHFLAGEQAGNDPEMIIDANAYKQISPQIKYALHREIARIKGFQVGLYPQQAVVKQEITQSNTGNVDNTDNKLLIDTLLKTNQILEKLEADGIIAYMSRDLRNAKLIRDDIKDYETLRNKNKRNS